MVNTTNKRGRPRKPHPMSDAERMRAYRKRKRNAGLKSVRRWESEDSDRWGHYSDHQILDARSLAMHCKIAKKISRDPGLLNKARDNLSRWSSKYEGPKPRYFVEWKEILDMPWPAIAAMITSMSEDATRLRSSSPFAGILNDKERDQVYATFRA